VKTDDVNDIASWCPVAHTVGCCASVPLVHCWIWLRLQLHCQVRGARCWIAVVQHPLKPYSRGWLQPVQLYMDDVVWLSHLPGDHVVRGGRLPRWVGSVCCMCVYNLQISLSWYSAQSNVNILYYHPFVVGLNLEYGYSCNWIFLPVSDLQQLQYCKEYGSMGNYFLWKCSSKPRIGYCN